MRNEEAAFRAIGKGGAGEGGGGGAAAELTSAATLPRAKECGANESHRQPAQALRTFQYRL